MINFDDGLKSQLIYAKPILDKYGFKASFFIICGRVGTELKGLHPYFSLDPHSVGKGGKDTHLSTMVRTVGTTGCF
jgi:hypothetical protein